MNMSRPKSSGTFDVVIVGGGIVGLCIGYGLVKCQLRVAVLDGNDADFSASRGNFGMISVSNKGFSNIPYFRLSLTSGRLWPLFAEELRECSGIDPRFQGRGKVYLSVGDRELDEQRRHIEEFSQRAGAEYRNEILDRDEVDALLGHVGLGEAVSGGSFSPLDGAVDPLKFYSSLLRAYQARGGHYLFGHIVDRIVRDTTAFFVRTPAGQFSAPRVVIAAGLGIPPLAKEVGLQLKVRPERGQIIVTERIDQVFKYPISGFLRQNVEGTVMIGSSSEYAGRDDRTTVEVLKELAKSAVERLPSLRSVQINRCWACLRPRTQDGYPIYQESSEQPGAFVVSCHSGITLAALHTRLLPQWIMEGARDRLLEPFGLERFRDEQPA
ncbi:Hydrogen cyanide synthase subunit HcnC [Ensifer psoraleae]|uniref:NAD(P)/FAD-dependent oxidoreductase n=1 Tax=Sinorhizobium psoraleae TaxID=520838 RepID=UPI0024AA3F23|nr:FAD-dependent oxidoreductase [Sinorhizobium psoraleae]NRP70912.1 Hydrogen cyanide synthase subunit HcnC [Sinorhizobium psoraleae]